MTSKSGPGCKLPVGAGMPAAGQRPLSRWSALLDERSGQGPLTCYALGCADGERPSPEVRLPGEGTAFVGA